MKKALLPLVFTLFSGLVFGQGPVLELDVFSPVNVPPGTLGPITTPMKIAFSLDEQNIDNTYSAPANPLDATIFFRNQVFTGLNYFNLTDGLTFGGGATLSSVQPGQPGGQVQQSATNPPYDLLGTYPNNGGPKSYMFTSNPYASVGQLGTGFDVDGDLFYATQNGGFQLFTAAQVLYDNGVAKDARVYFGDLVIRFSQPVKDPVIHLAGLGGSYSFLPRGAVDSPQNYKTSYFSTELELANSGLTSTLLSSNPLMTLSGNNILNNYAYPNGNSVDIVALGYSEYPINNYGAMTGSIRLNGIVQEVVYRVYLKGSPNSVINWSTDGIDTSFTPDSIYVTNATRDPFTGDIWWLSLSLLNPYQQLSGNVYLDADALINNDIHSTAGVDNPKTNANGTLYANLIDNNTGLIAGIQPINPDGTYLFDSIPTGTYRVSLSTIPGTIGSTPPAAILPTGMMNTGEQIGYQSGSDGNVNGVSGVVTILPESVVTNVNFGIQTIPNSDPKTQVIPQPVNNIIPQSTATNAVSGIDAEDGVLGNPQTIVIKALPNNSIPFYAGVQMTVGTVITNFNPGLLSYTNVANGSTSTTFEYSFRDRAQVEDPTPATYTLTWSIPLSVKAVSLNGKMEISSNSLNWVYDVINKDLDYSKLYRSVNNGGLELVAQIVNNGSNEYSFRDEKVNDHGKYQYHVVGVMKDGEEIKSKEVILNRGGAAPVSLYPNPVKDVFTIEFAYETNVNTTVLVKDALGKVVKRVELGSGFKTSYVNIESLASGLYNVTIDNEEIGSQTIQIIKK